MHSTFLVTSSDALYGTCACARAGGIYDYNHSATGEKQFHYYKMVYAMTESSMKHDRPIKGILFWRWKAMDPTIKLGTPDEAATLGTGHACPFWSPKTRCRGERHMACNMK